MEIKLLSLLKIYIDKAFLEKHLILQIFLKMFYKSKKIERKITKELNIIGLLAVEMFVLKNEDIMVNEIAPRPHNSGHWTKDACNISQFDALVRTILTCLYLKLHILMVVK